MNVAWKRQFPKVLFSGSNCAPHRLQRVILMLGATSRRAGPPLPLTSLRSGVRRTDTAPLPAPKHSSVSMAETTSSQRQ
eukprot:CAMPEP_0198729468 /NCGR_PEP_ID=MMETSP1475-20131203/18578_1 /TAXON_ID= ORGANISM="Unidentified sp., Strain CCMP1999" /NCGR_SAMPLE_ID=MMETSP1475 /ASSEMBLY_ACC=CAM_ASM_001111 /LENGTH=78 /DNA_ID=CAMNT_0044492129 /DNA_START=371 /DNA_END=607 /DNA_ORIENTATION=-